MTVSQIPTPAFDILTVCFSGEIDLLRLQARSLAAFFPAENLKAIHVVVNDVDEVGCLQRLREILPEYGPHQAKVRLIRGSRLMPLHFAGLNTLRQIRLRLRRRDRGGWMGHEGWFVQQVLKLRAASLVGGSHALILDAKNHFLKPVAVADMIAPDGRARTRFLRYAPDDRKRTWLAKSFLALGLPEPDLDAPHPPTVTPIVLERDVFRTALQHIENRLGPLDLFFLRRRRQETEFFLIYAAVEGGTSPWVKAFADGLFASGTVFRSTSEAQIDEMLCRAEDGEQMMLGVHRARVRGLSWDQAVRLEQIWHRTGLLRPDERFRDLFPADEPTLPAPQDRFHAPDSRAGSPPMTSHAILRAR